MKQENKGLNLEEAIQREWIITNGIGGYASSTIVGANTRKYHGLLVAPFTPPGNRNLTYYTKKFCGLQVQYQIGRAHV